MMRQRVFVAAMVVTLAGCVPWPSGDEIEKDIEKQLASVIGPWQGLTFEPNALTLAFELRKLGDSLIALGTMVESDVGDTLPILVRGTFRRPVLTLQFSGLRYEGHSVTITDFQGWYTTLGGVGDSVTLQGVNYSRRVRLLLQEAL